MSRFVALFCGGRKMFSKLVDALFGCRHTRYSFPITVRAGSRRTPTARHTGTYVACLHCGRYFRYDWHAMKNVESQAKETEHSLFTKEAPYTPPPPNTQFLHPPSSTKHHSIT